MPGPGIEPRSLARQAGMLLKHYTTRLSCMTYSPTAPILEVPLVEGATLDEGIVYDGVSKKQRKMYNI